MMRRRMTVAVSLLAALVASLLGWPAAGTAATGVQKPGVAVPSGTATTWWHPGPLSSWQYDLEWPVAVPTNIGAVQVYDIDYDGSEQGTEAQVTALVSRIHVEGSRAICYLETGAWENYRPDAGQYPSGVLGTTVGGYPDERYVDIRQWPVLAPILDARFRQCKAEGFDGVETDIDDSYTENTGFPLTLQDEVTFDTEVAAELHSLGLAWFLKNGINDDAFITDMAPVADGTVNEQCWQYDECSQLEPFVKAGKPVLNVEYANLSQAATCAQAHAFPMATMHTDVDLDGNIAWACWRPGGTTTTSVTTTVPAGRRPRPPSFVSAAMTTAIAGRPFSFTVRTRGYPYSHLSHSPLPPGLKWSAGGTGTATIAGTPPGTARGPHSIALMAKNALGLARQVLRITVS